MPGLFYSEGLRFSCTRCSSCCRHEPGFVFIRKKDLILLEKQFKIGYIHFMEKYCRWVPSGSGSLGISGSSSKLSLKEKPNFDCIFWKEKCLVYESRPVQCRSFPFWPSFLLSKDAWKNSENFCPGINQGKLHKNGEISKFLIEMKEDIIETSGNGDDQLIINAVKALFPGLKGAD